ncbi:8190_t:CDS:1, partial [Funneliformis geosporum]
MQYAHGTLRQYLNKNTMTWDDILFHLKAIAAGLETIHEKKLIHRDLHIGNILYCWTGSTITDLGLCGPIDKSNHDKSNIYGVLPYIAPEILNGQDYTSSSDIYSFGMIAYEIISGSPPFPDISHDEILAIKICQGLRPKFKIKVPQLLIDLIKKCLDANPLIRPTATELLESLKQWYLDKRYNNVTEFYKQVHEAEEFL